MKATKTVTVRLDIDDYERLVSEAGRLAISPVRLAQSFVRAGLAGSDAGMGADLNRIGHEALEGLRRVRQRLPEGSSIDGVALVREGRDALEQRTAL